MGKINLILVQIKDYLSKDGIHLVYPRIILNRDMYKVLCKTIQDDQANYLIYLEVIVPHPQI